MMTIIRKPKHTHTQTKNQKKKKNTRNKMAGPTFKKTNEPPKKANHKRNIKFLNPLQLVATSISNKEGEPYTQAYSTASVYISTLTLVHKVKNQTTSRF